MEFNEKLQILRKDKGVTQEELAEALFVSRTAISKWESGKGYPGIDSLKGLSRYFGVTLDELLSAEKLLSIAEKENRANMKNMCEVLFSVVDVFSVLLILLPLYPNVVDGFVYSVNLLAYTGESPLKCGVYWTLFGLLIILGLTKLLAKKLNLEKVGRMLTIVSVTIGVLAVLILSLTREAYATAVSTMLLVIKGAVLLNGVNFSKES